MSTKTTYKEVTNETGRVFRVGESPAELLGFIHSRWVPVVAAWVAMMLAGLLEYTWGALSGSLAANNNWAAPPVFWLFSVYVIFEAFIQIITGRLREKGILPVRLAVVIGGIICGVVAYGWLASTTDVFQAFLSYAALGGIGSGMVYSSCINIVGKWWPEKKGWRTGFVNGGWAYGAVPFIIGIGATASAGGALTMTPAAMSGYIWFQGIVMTVGIGIAGLLMKDPPKNWWPAHIDPLRWREKSTRDLLHNPPAPMHLNVREMWHTPQAKWIGLQYAFFIGSSLFGVAYYYPFAEAMGLGTVAAVAGFAGFALNDGIFRAFYGLLSEFIGRRHTMTFGYTANAITQGLALIFGLQGWLIPFTIAAVVSGGFSGTNFPMTAAMVADYYGETNNATNYGSIYAWKALGGSFAGGVASLIMTGTLYGTATFNWVNGFAFGVALAAIAAVMVHFLCKAPTVEQMRRAREIVAKQTAAAGLKVAAK